MYVDSGGAISVYDPRASRITRWRSNGELDRVVPVPWLAKGPLHVVHLTPGGEALGLRSEIEIENEMPKLVGLWRSNAVAVNLNRELHLQDTLAVFPGSERYYYGMRGYKQARFTMPLLAARPVYAFHGDCLYALIAEGVTIGEFCRPARGVRRRFEWPQADLDVSKDAFVRHGSATFERRARQSLAAADFLRTYPFDIPDKRPPAGGLVVDEAGYLWLADFFEVDAAASDWVIFDPTGVLRIRLHNPHIYRILSIGRDYLLALQRVELDVEQVVLYDLPTEWR